jgi:hypothetical protein
VIKDLTLANKSFLVRFRDPPIIKSMTFVARESTASGDR